MTGDAAECRCGAKVDANVEGVEMSANAVLQLMWTAGLNARLLKLTGGLPEMNEAEDAVQLH